MKQLWLQDECDIRLEIERLVREEVKLICGHRGVKNLTQLKIKGVVKGAKGDIFVLFHPHEPTCTSSSCSFYYHPAGKELRCFSSLRVKKADRFLGLKLPSQIFKVYVRQHERVKGARASSLTFVIPNKQRVFTGRVENISQAGCKILGEIPSLLKKGDTVNNLTLTLFTKSSGQEMRLHIPEATIIWVQTGDARTDAFGVHFAPTGQAQQRLSEYIDLRLIEDSV